MNSGASDPAGAVPRRLLYLVTEDWFFLSHFLERARAARRAGYRVAVAARMREGRKDIEAEGFEAFDIPFRRRSAAPRSELATLIAIRRLYAEFRPDIVHHVALKPILYGTLAARMLGISGVVNAPVGMGHVFTSSSARSKLLKPFAAFALRRLLNPRGSRVVIENRDDLAAIVARGEARAEDIVLIRGAGVDLDRFRPGRRDGMVPKVVMGARLLRDKGVLEYLQAARILRDTGVSIRLLLAGAPDPENPSSLDPGLVGLLAIESGAEWFGHQTDMARLLNEADIACLPSYREGLPKFLLEAMASGLPVVATDVEGCREAVVAGVTGLLVPPRDANALASALARLAGDADMRRRMGDAARARSEEEFGDPVVIRQTLALYDQLGR